MKVSKFHPFRCEGIEVRRIDLAAEAANIGPAHIIGHDQQNIWLALGRMGLRQDRCGDDKGRHHREEGFI